MDVSLFFVAIYVASFPLSFRALTKEQKRVFKRKYLNLVDVIYCMVVSVLPGINTLYALWYSVGWCSTEINSVAQKRFFEDNE